MFDTVEIWHKYENRGDKKKVVTSNEEFFGKNIEVKSSPNIRETLFEDGVRTYTAEKGFEFVASKEGETVVLECVPRENE